MQQSVQIYINGLGIKLQVLLYVLGTACTLRGVSCLHRIHLYGSKDGDITEGFMTPDGFWTGVYGLLQRREVELAFLPITMTSARIDIMDFTVPLMEMRTSVIIKEPDSYEMQWNSILVPFTWQLWIAVCVVMVLLIVCLATTHRLNCHYENVEDKDFGFMEAIFIVYAALCQQGHSDTPNSTSVRAVFVTSYLTGMFLLGCYSAAFITHLTLRDPVLPFTDFKGLLEDGSYRLGMALISAQLEYFRNSSNELLRDIYWKMIAPHEATLELTDFPGLQRLCYDRKYAHLASDYMLVLPGYLPQCSITLVPQAFYPGTMALATVKRSPYLGLLNYMLQRMRRHGLLRGLYERFLFKLRLATQQAQEKKKLSVDLSDVAPVFLTLAVGIAFSFALFLFEFYIM